MIKIPVDKEIGTYKVQGKLVKSFLGGQVKIYHNSDAYVPFKYFIIVIIEKITFWIKKIFKIKSKHFHYKKEKKNVATDI